MDQIPKILVDKIKKGEAGLFLGSGASFDAKHPIGKKIPLGNELGELLSDEFLAGDYKDYPLQQIGELAISENDLFSVQSFIADIFIDFYPNDFHNIIPQLNWPFIFTTNYDQIVEKAYQTQESNQNIVVFIKNGERIESRLKDHNSIVYIKLHGCISVTVNFPGPTEAFQPEIDPFSRAIAFPV